MEETNTYSKLMEEVNKIGEMSDIIEASGNSNEIDLDAIAMPPQQTNPALTASLSSTAAIDEFVTASLQELIISNIETVKKVKNSVQVGMDWREVESFAELVKATTGAMAALQKLNADNKKLKVAQKLKKMDIEAKQTRANKIVNNVLIASREEVLNKLIGKVPLQLQDATIEATIEEENPAEN